MATVTQDPTTLSWTPINMWAMLRALVNNNCPILTYNFSQNGSVAPISGTSGYAAGQAGPGTILIDFTNANIYFNGGTLLSPTWLSLGGNSVYSIQTLANNTAIPPTQTAQYAITKGSAETDTIAAPTTNGVEIMIISDTAFAHIITFTGGTLDSGNAAVTTATFNAFKGASLTVVSFNSRWKVVASNGVNFS